MNLKNVFNALFMIAIVASMAFIGMSAGSDGAQEPSNTESSSGTIEWGSGVNIGSISVEVGKPFSFSKDSWGLPSISIASVSVDWVDIAYSSDTMAVSGTAPSDAGTYSVTAPFSSAHGSGTLTLTIEVWKEVPMKMLSVGSEQLPNTPKILVSYSTNKVSESITGEFSGALVLRSAGSPQSVIGGIVYGDERLAFDSVSEIEAPGWVSSITKFESVGQIGGHSGFHITGKVPEGHELKVQLMETADGYSIRFYSDGVPSVYSDLSFASAPKRSGVFEWHGL